ncbi:MULTISPECIES: DUF1566 domain-containing protein [Gammaproteobacteria]|uniref:Lcl domain-containing protein n=1 Tax=Gammaproteobacteria TaxID=1236 RepID=UPI000DD04CB7|nr:MULTISPECIES: DUF1566 domain-containing protein [Gammaproteobacteria]RTE86040.1 DUF1566 domain-containing protein [Aliidiomarina sp. B3213]TCZ91394.1 DUF1566 domain-containing protein [Lysobacter sp. N42]
MKFALRVATVILLVSSFLNPSFAQSSDVIGDRYLAIESGSVIRDLVTGLEWQRCSYNRVWDGSTCTGLPSTHSFAGAAGLVADGGFALPTKEQLRTLVYCSNTGEYDSNGDDAECGVFGTYLEPTIDTVAFPTTASDFYWTSNEGASATDGVYVYFSNGQVSETEKSTELAARLVRQGTFVPTELTVTTDGGGTGTIMSSPAGINCGSTCSYNFNQYLTVTLTATADAGSEFVGWLGCDNTTENSCEVMVSDATTVTATFDVAAGGGDPSDGGSGDGTMSDRYMVVGDGSIIRDTETNLEWQRCSVGQTWSGSTCTGEPSIYVYADALDLTADGGFVLPTQAQLRTLVYCSNTASFDSNGTNDPCGEPETFVSPAIDSAAFPAIALFNFYWTATPGDFEGEAYIVDFSSGLSAPDFDFFEQAVRLVREAVAQSYTLTITEPQNGTVTSSPEINCGEVCEATYPEGTEVTLTATPDDGYVFDSWTGCTSETTRCTVMMDAAKTVAANFRLFIPTSEGYIIDGRYEVQSDPSLVLDTVTNLIWKRCTYGQEWVNGRCTEAATSVNDWNDAILLPDDDSDFGLPTRDQLRTIIYCSNTGEYNLNGTANGCDDFSSTYDRPTINLTAFPGTATDVYGAYWTSSTASAGDVYAVYFNFGNIAQTSVVHSEPAYVRLVREAVPQSYTLNITEPQNGTVTSSPEINCGEVCEATYPEGTEVTLTATPDDGYVFDSWTGCTSETTSCTVMMDAAKTVAANFAVAAPQYTLDLNIIGEGSVRIIPGVIVCDTSCEVEFDEAIWVTLIATTGGESITIKGWSGCDNSVQDSCSVRIDQARTVTVEFGMFVPVLPDSEIDDRYVVQDDPSLVLDTVNNLIWQRCAVGQVWNNAACEGSATLFSWSAAQTLTRPGNFRAPTIDELRSIVFCSNREIGSQYEQNEDKRTCGATGEYESPTINGQAFPDTLPRAYWSSTPYSGRADERAWAIHFEAGFVTDYDYAGRSEPVRLVKVIEPTTYNLSINKNGTGTGVISSSPGSIICGQVCTEDFVAGTTVSLTVGDDPSIVTTWTGCDSVSALGVCTVTVDEDKSVAAQLDIRMFTVEFLDIDGNRIGDIQSVPYGGDAVPPDAPEVQGKVFAGWVGGSFENVTESVTLTARYDDLPPTGENLDFSNVDGGESLLIEPDIANRTDTTTLKLISEPGLGTLSDSARGWTYQVNGREMGTDSFTYAVTDGDYQSATYTVGIEVIWGTRNPIAVADTYTPPYSDTNQYVLNVTENDFHSGAEVSVNAVGTPQYVTRSDSGSAFIATVPANFSGRFEFDYRLVDENGASEEPAKVVVTIESPPEPQGPVFSDSSLERVRINATGLNTSISSIPVPEASDAQGNSVVVSGPTGTREPGLHYIQWRAIDDEGLETTATQELWIDPIISISAPTIRFYGNVANVGVSLNGTSPDYPLVVPYTLYEGDLTAGPTDEVVIVNNGQVTLEDEQEAGESEQQVSPRIGEYTVILDNEAGLNISSSHSVANLIYETDYLDVQLEAYQNNQLITEIDPEGGLVEIRVIIHAFPESLVYREKHTFRTYGPNLIDESPRFLKTNIRVDFSDEERIYRFDPRDYNQGTRFKFKTRLRYIRPNKTSPAASDTLVLIMSAGSSVGESMYSAGSANGERNSRNLSSERNTSFDVDTDRDGIPDNIEGAGDSDGDFIPDFLDSISRVNLLQMELFSEQLLLLEAEPWVTLSVGETAFTAVENYSGAIVDQAFAETMMAQENEFSFVSPIIDFEASSELGESNLNIVVPQLNSIPAEAVYRLYVNESWVSFLQDENNSVASASTTVGVCPPPRSALWQPGLNEGHVCIQVTLEDGGLNDSDGEFDGEIAITGAVAVPNTGNNAPEVEDIDVTLKWNIGHDIEVLDYASDVDGDALYIIAASAQFGSATVVDGQFIHYEPPQNFGGTTTITYSVSDGAGGVGTGVINVVVRSNLLPEVADDAVVSDDRSVIDIDVLANDYDPENDVLTVVSASAQQGTVEIIDGQLIRYTPVVGFGGTDVVSYTVEDPQGGSASGEVSISLSVVETIEITGKSSGGSMSPMFLALFALLMVWRFTSLRHVRNAGRFMGVAVVGLLVLMAQPVVAHEHGDYQIELGAGISDVDVSRSGIEQALPAGATIQRYRSRNDAVMVEFTHSFADSWRLAVGYVDLGSAHLNLRVDTTTPSESFAELEGLLAIRGAGYTVGVQHDVPVFERLKLGVDAGLYAWDGERSSFSTWGDSANTSVSGYDPYYGVSAAYAFSEQTGVRLRWRSYQLEDVVDTLTFSIYYRF